MTKGIIYVTLSEIDGLIKIGRTQNLKKRINELCTTGYMRQKCDVVFAIEVENFVEKEDLLHTIFGKGRVGTTEFFAEDINIVKQTMASFEGLIVYPDDESMDDIFKEATEAVSVKNGVIPAGTYTMSNKNQKTNENCTGTLVVSDDNVLTLKAGALLSQVTQKSPMGWMKVRRSLNVENNILKEDLICASPSMAAAIVCGHNKNGWESWKNKEGKLIDIYRKKGLDSED